ncbi:hypothetical protein BKA62DRAFT_831262 [Auriculariales sp. MPI-PUGE-AT-0066]|nr:hypothetical protein BKA62DRAFT_831262 [Auriculariales sp. MPI-PUGE-AT-0066]
MSQPRPVTDWAIQLPERVKIKRLARVHDHLDPELYRRYGDRERFLNICLGIAWHHSWAQLSDTKAEETLQALQPRMLKENTNGLFQQRGYAFIKPDEFMGPDLLAMARLPDGTLILIVVQCKDVNENRARVQADLASLRASITALSGVSDAGPNRARLSRRNSSRDYLPQIRTNFYEKLSSAEVLKLLAKLAPNETGWWSKRRPKKYDPYVDAIEQLFPVRDTKYEFINADIPLERDARPNTLDVYEGHPRCAVLRVIAAPELEVPDDNTRIGVKVALQHAQVAELTEIKEANDIKKKRQSLATPLIPVPRRRQSRLRKSTPKVTSSLSGRSTSRSLRTRSVPAAPSDDASLSDGMSLSDHPLPSEDFGYSDDMGPGDDNGPGDDTTSLGDTPGPSCNVGVGVMSLLVVKVAPNADASDV